MPQIVNLNIGVWLVENETKSLFNPHDILALPLYGIEMNKSFKLIFLIIGFLPIICFAQNTSRTISDGYHYIPNNQPIPSITDSVLEQDLNQIIMKKKDKRNSFYISATVFINRDGSMDDLEIRKCSNIPACPDKLRNKHLHSELNKIISRITWSPIRFEGEFVNCYTIINLQVEKGRFRIIKDKNAI